MKNVLGQTPRGEDFFPRDAIINRIYRRLESGSHVFLAAPRRVGKTSIMRYLEDHPRPNYTFVYVITESVQEVEAFYQKVLEETLKSDAFGRLARKKEKVQSLVRDILSRLENIKLHWFEFKFSPVVQKMSFQEAFEQLMTQLETTNETLVIMIDEFPQAIENIKERRGAETARTFLRLAREHRQKASSNIRFLYTGSIGLPAVVKKLTSMSVINDLNVIEIPPLSEEEATKMITQLLENYQVPHTLDMIDYLLEKIKWLIPFHIQLAVQELINVFEKKNKPLQYADVDLAFIEMLNIRNDIYFDHYYTRLETSFPHPLFDFALTLLAELAERREMSSANIKTLAEVCGVNGKQEMVMDSLTYDGYIHFDQTQGVYRFNSNLLQQWWTKKNP